MTPAQWQLLSETQTTDDPHWGEIGQFSEQNNPGKRSQGSIWSIENDVFMWGGFGNRGTIIGTVNVSTNFFFRCVKRLMDFKR